MDTETNYNAVIRQTGRTMIIESFNNDDNHPGLDIQLSGWDGSEKDKIIQQIDGKREKRYTLLTHSFDEFLKRFEPTIYCYRQMASNGKWSTLYDRRPKIDGWEGIPVKLTDEPFYKAVREVLNRKEREGKASLDFDYQSVLDEYMSPKMEMARAQKIRRKVKFLDEKAREEALQGHDGSAKEYLKKRNREMLNTAKKYCQDPLNLVPLCIEDINTVIETRTKALPANDGQTGEIAPVKFIELTWDQTGKLIPRDEQSNPRLLGAGEAGTLAVTGSAELAKAEPGRNPQSPPPLPAVWDKALSATPSDLTSNEFLKKLFLSAFSTESIQVYGEMELEELQERRNLYVDFYQESQQSYIDAVFEMTRKILDVEMFFRHAGDQNGYFKEGVLITNCTVGDLLERETEEKFDDFLKRYSDGDLRTRKIWLAVLPSALDSGENYQKVVSRHEELDLEDPLYGFDAEAENAEERGLDIGSLNRMCEKLIARRIVPFFNFNATKDTCTGGVDIDALEYYRRELQFTPKRAVLSYPNFLAVDSNEGHVFIGQKSNGENAELYLPDIFLDAAYVAAGTVAATQSVDRLKQHGYGVREIINTNPCVHFDLNANDAKSRFMTRVSKESISMKSREFNERMGQERMGFFFDMDYNHMNMVVQQACAVSGDGSRGLPVKTILTENYIDAYIRSKLPNAPVENDITEQIDLINKDEAISAQNHKNALNPLLNAAKGEKITWDSEGHKIIVMLDKQALAIDFEVEQEE